MQTRKTLSFLAGGERVHRLQHDLRDATLRMKRSIAGVPVQLRSAFYAISQSDPRRHHLMGRYPEAAFIFAAHGAPWEDVTAPLRELEASLWAEFYAQTHCSLDAIQQAETEAQGGFDEIQVVLREDSPIGLYDIALDAAERHRVELNRFIAWLRERKRGASRPQIVRAVA